MNEQERALVQLADLKDKYGIAIKVTARPANADIPYTQLHRFFSRNKQALDPKQLERLERFYNRVTGGVG